MKSTQNIKTVLVTGASGQLGQTIKAHKTLYGDTIFKFKNSTELDITNHEQVREYFEISRFNYVINCAAYTNVELAEKEREKAFEINAEAVKNLAETCSKYQCTLIHISTDYVFDGKTNKPYSESDKPNPINTYGKSKLQGEVAIQNHLKNYYIIRTSWLYSAYRNNFFSFIHNNIEDSKELTITTNQRGVPTSTKSLTNFILFLIENTADIPFGTYNYVDDGNATWFDFAKRIVTHYFPEKISHIKKTNNFKTKAKRPAYSVLSNDKIKGFYKIIPKWGDALKEVF